MGFELPDFASAAVWMSLLTLTFLEIVLGIDNIIFISIAANKLPESQQKRATNIGLALAMVLRIVLLFGISWLIALQDPIFKYNYAGEDTAHGGAEAAALSFGFTGQSLILLLGGIFLIYKATKEIHHKLDGAVDGQAEGAAPKSHASFSSIVTQITVINIVFSFDSILTAVGMTNGVKGALPIMIIAVVLSVGVMVLFATPVARFVNRNPTVQMLGMAFLILIGFTLLAEGAHLGHLQILGSEVGAIPKGYLYFAIAFSLGVEFLNMKLRKRNNPVQLHGYQEEARREGLLPVDAA